MVHMSSSLGKDMAHSSSENQSSLASLFFLGLPILQGIFCRGDEDSTIFPPYASLFASGFTWFDMIVSVGKRITPFMSLGILVAGENESQSFWGLDL